MKNFPTVQTVLSAASSDKETVYLTILFINGDSYSTTTTLDKYLSYDETINEKIREYFISKRDNKIKKVYDKINK